MTKRGIRIAKPGKKVTDNPEDQYVDSDTPIFKVALQGSGTMVSDGVTRAMAWKGDFPGETTDDITNGYFFTVKIPHNLGYTPTFIAYAELIPGSRRIYLTALSSISETDGLLAGAICYKDRLELNFFPITGGFHFDQPPPAGEYGFAFYIFQDEANPDV